MCNNVIMYLPTLPQACPPAHLGTYLGIAVDKAVGMYSLSPYMPSHNKPSKQPPSCSWRTWSIRYSARHQSGVLLMILVLG